MEGKQLIKTALLYCELNWERGESFISPQVLKKRHKPNLSITLNIETDQSEPGVQLNMSEVEFFEDQKLSGKHNDF